MINGILIVQKEQGFTSADVVAKLRGILKQKKIGHTGTLDPNATGVLPICLGNATKICDMLTDQKKEYIATLRLGLTSDTQDIWGQILSDTGNAWKKLKKEEMQQAIDSFVGEYMQLPPMYSALKINGKRLYELAREGKEVERKLRKVIFYQIEILSLDLPEIKIRVECSKGTYIRTLCYDIGKKLGCGALMSSLIRTRTGGFALSDSYTLSEIQKYKDENKVQNLVKSVDSYFSIYPAIKVMQESEKRLHNGNKLAWTHLEKVNETVKKENSFFRIYDYQNVFFGIYYFDCEEDILRPWKMFPDIK